MRELKFRAWDFGQFPKMEYEVTIMNGTDWSCYDDAPIKGRAIMQYTGLEDKKGKEIYCSDILREKWKSGFDREDGSIGIVVWSQEFAGWAIKTDGHNFHLNHHPELNKKYEIIGNIHENPELLKEKTCKK